MVISSSSSSPLPPPSRTSVSLHLQLLVDQAVLEEHQDGVLGAIVLVAVLQQTNGSVTVHRLSGEELQVLEPWQDVFDGLLHVRLEGVHLVGVLLLQLSDDPGKEATEYIRRGIKGCETGFTPCSDCSKFQVANGAF